MVRVGGGGLCPTLAVHREPRIGERGRSTKQSRLTGVRTSDTFVGSGAAFATTTEC